MSEYAMTAEGLETLRAEIEQLEGPGREEIAKQIKTAREWGDLKENAEYHAAKEAQAHLETKILRLREQLLNAHVTEAAGGSVVSFGSTVEVEDPNGKRHSYTLVSARDASPSDGRLSVESPMATALNGLSAGEDAVVQTPRGERRLKVVSVG